MLLRLCCIVWEEYNDKKQPTAQQQVIECCCYRTPNNYYYSVVASKIEKPQTKTHLSRSGQNNERNQEEKNRQGPPPREGVHKSTSGWTVTLGAN